MKKPITKVAAWCEAALMLQLAEEMPNSLSCRRLGVKDKIQ